MTDAPITQPKAKEMLAVMVEKDFWGVLKNTIPYWDEMNDNQSAVLTELRFQPWGALLRFAWVYND